MVNLKFSFKFDIFILFLQKVGGFESQSSYFREIGEILNLKESKIERNNKENKLNATNVNSKNNQMTPNITNKREKVNGNVKTKILGIQSWVKDYK